MSKYMFSVPSDCYIVDFLNLITNFKFEDWIYNCLNIWRRDFIIRISMYCY